MRTQGDEPPVCFLDHAVLAGLDTAFCAVLFTRIAPLPQIAGEAVISRQDDSEESGGIGTACRWTRSTRIDRERAILPCNVAA